MHIPGSFSFPDTYEHAKKSAQFIHSFLRYSRVPMTLKATPIFDHVHPITIKVTFSFPEYVLVCNMSARLIHSFKDQSPMPIFDHNQPKVMKVILNFPFLTGLITD